VIPQLPKLDELRGSANVPLGVDSANHLQFADLSSSGRSHVLVAGTTGSGKSEWLRMVVAGLIATNTPDTMRFVTLDPKLAAFGELERSHYLWRSNSWWIPNTECAASELFQELIDEMDRRYELVHAAGSDNLREYVDKTKRPMPRIVCICDEYFALVSQQKQEKQAIEQAVALLGAKGRAAGIHLILATQQPSRATISGAIQANLPCRVALYLQNPIESNMILNQPGAERLTGSGDLLYKDFGTPVRLQAPYLLPEERAKWLRR
jgi:DNA segregation ATPase FtsK/SpoIIIE-like protein